jgi:hypothetical protein
MSPHGEIAVPIGKIHQNRGLVSIAIDIPYAQLARGGLVCHSEPNNKITLSLGIWNLLQRPTRLRRTFQRGRPERPHQGRSLASAETIRKRGAKTLVHSGGFALSASPANQTAYVARHIASRHAKNSTFSAWIWGIAVGCQGRLSPRIWETFTNGVGKVTIYIS